MNNLTTIKGLIHKTDADPRDTRTHAVPYCTKRAIDGWVSAGEKEPLVINGLAIERRCPKAACYGE